MASVQCRKTFTENYGTMQNESYLSEMKLNKLSVSRFASKDAKDFEGVIGKILVIGSLFNGHLWIQRGRFLLKGVPHKNITPNLKFSFRRAQIVLY